MLKKIHLIVVLLTIAAFGFSQTGVIKVVLIDGDTKEGIPFANIVAFSNGGQAGGATTNIDGEALIKPLAPGKYTLKATYVGFQPVEMTDIIVSADKTAYVNIPMSKGIELQVVTIKYDKPLIRPDVTTGINFNRDEIDKMASQSIGDIVGLGGGTFQSDAGGQIYMRGSRADATDVYIDGVKTIGSANIPRQGIEEISTTLGGLPAQYGDASGGITSITTRGPQANYSGAIEYRNSFPGLDEFGHHFLNFSIGGPILKKRDTTQNVNKSVLGFFLSGALSYDKDASPSSLGYWRANDEKRQELEESPLRPSAQGSGFVRNAEYLRKEDLVFQKYAENAASKSLNLSGKIVYKPSNLLTLSLGGTFDYNTGHAFIQEYALVNTVNNPLSTNNTWRVYGNITQRFGTQAQTQDEKEKSVSNIQNAYYTLLASYQQTNRLTQDDTHKDRLFDYGYIGKFEHYKTPFYILRDDTNLGTAYFMEANQDQYVNFTPSDVNPTGANWTKQFYELNNGIVFSDNQIQSGLALLNGDRPGNIYGLIYNTGRQYNGYEKSQASQFRIATSFSADIKKHAVQIGLEYEQRNDRAYTINPIGLWTLMRQLANKHITELDRSNPILVPELSGTYNYYRYENKYNAASQSYFDKSLRKKLGLAENNADWIDTDDQDPSLYSLNMFSADDLLQDGNAIVAYYGYDYLGKKIKGSTPFEDYFNKKDDNGNYARTVAPFQPIYMAGYIQDKFDFRDMKFLIGFRVDRYDANQKVLKDKYLLDEAKTAGEVASINGNTVTHPGNIGDDYVVYVDDIKNPRNILGYRNGNTWYNASGTEISDPTLVKTSLGTIAPYLVNAGNSDSSQKVTAKAFKDYVPQVTAMPRISFSFPISDVANFFAHYDIITQRPKTLNRLDPYNYLFLQENAGAFVNNPDLKPEKTVDYELGFSQKLSNISAITLSAYYKEMRDMVQVVRVSGAYPIDYITSGNIDFGTVKGFSAQYDLRRNKGVQLTLNYTLQFADGTNSAAADGYNLVSSGMPNLRTLAPLNIDRRHTINCNFDYRFGSKDNYNGPVWTKKKGDTQKTIQLLKDVGINLTFRAGSGTPYTRQSSITQLGVARGVFLKGSIRGSNLPWNYRTDIRFDKDINITWGNKEDAESKKSKLKIYLIIQNVLNTKNILAVYPATGNPDDDGFLTSAAAQSIIASQTDPQSYTDLYTIYMNNPGFYSLPRRIRIGAILDF